MEILLLIRSKIDGSTREVTYPIGDGLVIGRGAEEGVLLDGPDLSREHLMLSTDGTNFYVTDLSSNGTWLNGTRLKRSTKSRVRPDDLIEIPGYVLSFKSADQPKVETAAIQRPAPVPVFNSVAPPPPASKPGILSPVFGFIGSFSFGEKFLALVGAGGLILLYVYLAA